MLKTIKLYGVLAKKFGKQFKLDVANTREAVKALSVQIPGFEQFMLNAHHEGLAFAIWQDENNIDEKQLDMNTSASVIKIVPKVIGAGGGGGGLLGVILGAVLIVGGIFTGGLSTGLGIALIGAGAGLVVGGISQMLMPKVETADANSDGNKANKGFGGAVTTIAQGNPVPVLYGQREVGGFIASAAQYPEDLL